jgi:hypothetical protein
VRVVGVESIGIGNFERDGDSGTLSALCVAGVDQDCMIWGGENIPATLCKGERLRCSFRRHERGMSI